MEELVAFLREKGFDLAPSLDGQFHRFTRSGELSGWFIGRGYSIGAKQVLVARFGDWRTGEKYEWSSQGTYSSKEQVEIAKYLAEAQEQERQEKEKIHEDVAQKCQEKWETFNDRGHSPYLERKGLQGLFGCRLYPTKTGGVLTAIPARDVKEKLWGIQYVSPEGRKNFTAGMRIRGCFHLIGELNPHGRIYVAEGVATAATIYTAMGDPTAAAFNAGNLEPVCRALRESYPDSEIIICGDDDRWTRRPTGEPWNPGRECAEKAAKAVGGRAIFPRFTHDPANHTHPTQPPSEYTP